MKLWAWLVAKAYELNELLSSRKMAEDRTCVCGCGREVPTGWDGYHGR